MKYVVQRAAAWLVAAVCLAKQANAWVYPEHRKIALAGLAGLDPERRSVLDAMWAAAREGNTRLCAVVAQAEQGKRPECIDYAGWPAIAGDHSCSSRQMLDTILTSDWILDVAAIGARLEANLRRARKHSAVVNALRNSDINLQRADPEYATRAGANNVHFLLAREASTAASLTSYAAAAVHEGAEISALAAYSWYHIDALEKAHSLSLPGLSAEQRAALSRAALADEAFALHFLEDAFAAGHVAGTWGDAALRKGTHDYYNEHGLEVTTWRDERVVLAGDAWLRPEDAERAGRSVSRSLAQLIDAARGVGPAAAFRIPKPPAPAPGTLDTCRVMTVPAREHDARALLIDVLMDTPRPMLAAGLGEMPRFRAELGPFVGIQSAASVSTSSGGFGSTQTSPGGSAGLELAFRVGYGLEGILDQTSDGLLFLDLGVQQDSRSSQRVGNGAVIPEAGAITAAIPPRFGYVARLRMPFWIIPFDLLLVGPVLLLASPDTLAKMAVSAGTGGLIPWQAGISTPIGHFQFVLGREVGLGIFGYGARSDRFIVPDEAEGQTRYTLIELRSLQVELPVLEYRPFRAFSSYQSSTLLFQFYAALDVPTRNAVVAPIENPEPDLKLVGSLGLRMSFDWRQYW